MGRRVHHLHGLSWRIWRRTKWWWAESRSFALLLIHLHRLLLWILTRLSGFSLVPLNLRSRKPLGSLLCRFLSPFFIELKKKFSGFFYGFLLKFCFLVLYFCSIIRMYAEETIVEFSFIWLMKLMMYVKKFSYNFFFFQKKIMLLVWF